MNDQLAKNLEHRFELSEKKNADMMELLRSMYSAALNDTCGTACEMLADWMDEHGHLDQTGELKF